MQDICKHIVQVQSQCTGTEKSLVRTNWSNPCKLQIMNDMEGGYNLYKDLVWDFCGAAALTLEQQILCCQVFCDGLKNDVSTSYSCW